MGHNARLHNLLHRAMQFEAQSNTLGSGFLYARQIPVEFESWQCNQPGGRLRMGASRRTRREQWSGLDEWCQQLVRLSTPSSCVRNAKSQAVKQSVTPWPYAIGRYREI